MKILYITTVASTMNAFFKSHIEMLVNEGHSVDVACNDSISPVDSFYKELGCNYHRIDFSRTPLSAGNMKAYKQLKKVLEKENYDIVHCHTPTASTVVRLACRKFRKKNGLKVFYTAHGFHFFKGAPAKNWIIYYTIEKFCSRFTDKLITINKEDYQLAKEKFKAKEVHYVAGVGIELSKFDNTEVEINKKRKEIGVPEDAVIITSVGELIPRKNHKLAIQAITEINNEKIHYVIVGEGPLMEELKEFAKSNKIQDKVHLLGYRKDIAQLYKASDICCLPSIHEGLPVALMEGMACGLPVVCSEIRGNTDLIDNTGGRMFDYNSVEECRKAISDVISSDMKAMGKANREIVQEFSMEKITAALRTLYES